MTIDELIDFCRLQVDETEDSYWTPADWRSYALLAMKKFLVTTKLGLVRERIILDPNIVQPEETQHELQITCVADLPLGGNTINQQSFVLTDLSGQNWTFKYSTSGQVSTQAERDAFLFWVAITALDDAQTVALKTHAIIAASGFPAAAVLLAEFITITFNVAGYTTGGQNINVNNGVDTFAIDTLTQGYDDGYFLNFNIQEEKAILYIADGETTPVMRIGFEDYRLLTDEQKKDDFTCFIDTFKKKITVPWDTGEIRVHYYPSPEDSDIETFLASIIPSDYHEALAEYMLYLALNRDKNFTQAYQYRGLFKSSCDQAKADLAARERSNYNEDFDFSNYRPHANQYQDGDSGLFTRFGGRGR